MTDTKLSHLPAADRVVYTEVLTPPVGYRFSQAVLTTFSLDPAVLLEVPLSLALLGNSQSVEDPMALLAALEQNADRISVFVHAGRTREPSAQKPNPLYGLMERMIHEVRLPSGGAFHPKVWMLEFEQAETQEKLYRLVVLSRNLTRDDSWDLLLQLDGRQVSKTAQDNAPLCQFLSDLEGFVPGPSGKAARGRLKHFAKAAHSIAWEMPDGIQSVKFFLTGHKDSRYHWPGTGKRVKSWDQLAVISPFCEKNKLKELAGYSAVNRVLISREEELNKLPPELLGKFEKVKVLNPNLDDCQEPAAEVDVPSSGLHAKVFMAEYTYYRVEYTCLAVGSANATKAAFSCNCEFLVELTGHRSSMGGIDQLLSAEGLAPFLLDHHHQPQDCEDAEKVAAQEALEEARQAVVDAGLSLCCDQLEDDEDGWLLTSNQPLPALPGVSQLKVWPITICGDRATLVTSYEQPICMGPYQMADLTGLTAFSMTSPHPDVAPLSFVLNLPVTGLPKERYQALASRILKNFHGFLKYLSMLLGDMGQGAGTLVMSARAEEWARAFAAGKNPALLEMIIEAMALHPDRFELVQRAVARLRQADEDRKVIPEVFDTVWAVVEEAWDGR